MGVSSKGCLVVQTNSAQRKKKRYVFRSAEAKNNRRVDRSIQRVRPELLSMSWGWPVRNMVPVQPCSFRALRTCRWCFRPEPIFCGAAHPFCPPFLGLFGTCRPRHVQPFFGSFSRPWVGGKVLIGAEEEKMRRTVERQTLPPNVHFGPRDLGLAKPKIPWVHYGYVSYPTQWIPVTLVVGNQQIVLWVF